jgi:predicted YcjX-like family ATPase
VLGASWLPAPIAWLLGGGITRVAFAATKADHVADRQRGNLARLLETLAPAAPNRRATTGYFAIASVRCTEDIVWTLDGHPVSAVRGRVLGDDRLTRSYPGEVPDRPPDPDFWQHPFLALPQFEPARAAGIGAPMLPDLNLDRLLAFLLEDIL